MYVRLTPNAREMLNRSREFKRGIDNTVYHKGYPINYREQQGTPSIQISIAMDDRLADVDVDYRASFFPVSLFNGHLSAANSDVRAGDNAERHAGRWTGYQNWWRSFFGAGVERAAVDKDTMPAFTLPKVPRAGKKNINEMVPDFLQAWLVEGNVVAAMGYVSERSYACLAQDAPDPSAFDRGLAPVQILVNLKAAHDALGKHDSLEGLTIGVPLPIPGLRAVPQPHQGQFVLYDVPGQNGRQVRLREPVDTGRADEGDRARTASIMPRASASPGQRRTPRSRYCGPKRTGTGRSCPGTSRRSPMRRRFRRRHPSPRSCGSKRTSTLVQAAKTFVDTWLIRKDYDAAFQVLSTKSYACYDLVRGPDAPASTSLDDAGRKIRASLERIGQWVGTSRNLESIVEAAEPRHPSIRVMDQPYSHMFSLTSFPAALGDAVECDARARGAVPPDPVPLEYGQAFGMTFRFRTEAGDAPVLRLLWRKEGNAWRVTSYDVELP